MGAEEGEEGGCSVSRESVVCLTEEKGMGGGGGLGLR